MWPPRRPPNGTATLLTRRSGTDMNGYLILAGKAAEPSAALQLAQTVGARSDEDTLPEGLGETPVIGTTGVIRTSP